MQTPNFTKSNLPLHQWMQSEKLQGIVKKAQFLTQLSKLLPDVLDSDLLQHCRIANYEGDSLTLETDSAAWATRIRFSTPQLLKKFNSWPALSQIRKIHCRICPAVTEKSKPYWDKPVLSANSAQVITQAAAHISDPKLKNALLRLAQKSK